MSNWISNHLKEIIFGLIISTGIAFLGGVFRYATVELNNLDSDVHWKKMKDMYLIVMGCEKEPNFIFGK